MDAKVEQTLEAALKNWKSMAGSENDEAESTADEFEASFYKFIDAVREWVYGLDQRPQTLEELAELPLIKHILDLLPEPLHLNFETEAELILEHKSRIDEDKYD
ncbi:MULTISPECIES: hypothetical protein [Paenibacillus]|uniref:Uncharacterized protein n=2 Tax=Paenibacillus TaxID=44249 RepID=A0A7X2ZDF6_9BACL|nr:MULTISPECIES: hypothetical protein [Paenibacillus]MUG72898.1 hypothetical protein [Paenibacillus validus]